MLQNSRAVRLFAKKGAARSAPPRTVETECSTKGGEQTRRQCAALWVATKLRLGDYSDRRILAASTVVNLEVLTRPLDS